MKDKMALVICIIILMVIAFCTGIRIERAVIGDRIWPHQKDCYNEQDLQIIVYGNTINK